MSSLRRSRRRADRYFVLRRADRPPLLARISARGASSRFDPDSGTWINDPLLGAQIRMTGDWEKATPRDLPPGLDVDPADLAGDPPRRTYGRGGSAPEIS